MQTMFIIVLFSSNIDKKDCIKMHNIKYIALNIMIKTIILQKLGLRIQQRKDSFKGNDLWNNCFSSRLKCKENVFSLLKSSIKL